MENNNTQNDIQSRKRKYAVLLGFCGTGYHGMQYQPNVNTIETELFGALCKIGAIESHNQDSLSKIGFQRCARTDKGVHALGQVISAKLVIPEDAEEGWFARKMNEVLPDQIRVWGQARTNDKFNAKGRCSGRIYEYFMPTYVFRKFNEEIQELFNLEVSEQAINRMRRGFSDSTGKPERDDGECDVDEIGGDEDEKKDELGREMSNEKDYQVSQEELEEMKCYRMSDEELEKLKQLLELYKGTHNFHNFTVRRPFWNPSSQRHMISVSCDSPFVKEGYEWISLKFHGQSFMLHQIRKMVGFIILMMKLQVPSTLFRVLCGEVRVNIPKAPSVGLFLQEPLFDAFNKTTDQMKIKNPEFKGEYITFDPYRDEMEKFREKWIYSRIIQEELENHEFERWIKFLVIHSYEFAYLRRDGKVPEIYKKFATEGVYDRNRASKTAEKARRTNKRPRDAEEKDIRQQEEENKEKN